MEVQTRCTMCGTRFEAKTSWQRYCSRKCSSKRYRESKGVKVDQGRHCKRCGTLFYPPRKGGANKQHCSQECSRESAKLSRKRMYENDPAKLVKHRADAKARAKASGRKETPLARIWRWWPDVPRECQSCGESRVLDVAHRPDHARNGAWRTKANCQPHMIWILCPTCHALLDRLGYTAEQLGLPD